MQAKDIEASISYIRQELQYTDEQLAMALEKGLSALTVGADTYVQELQTSLGGMLDTEVRHFWLPGICTTW